MYPQIENGQSSWNVRERVGQEKGQGVKFEEAI